MKCIILGLGIAGLIACGSNGKDGKNGTDSFSTKTQVVSTTYCQYYVGENETTVLHLEWTDFSSGDRFLKCLYSDDEGGFQSNSNFRGQFSDYRNVCGLYYGYDALSYIEFNVNGDAANVSVDVPGVEPYNGDMSCKKETFRP